jgi:hypothetical protein
MKPRWKQKKERKEKKRGSNMRVRLRDTIDERQYNWGNQKIPGKGSRTLGPKSQNYRRRRRRTTYRTSRSSEGRDLDMAGATGKAKAKCRDVIGSCPLKADHHPQKNATKKPTQPPRLFPLTLPTPHI